VLKRTFRTKKLLLTRRLRKLRARELNELKRGDNGRFHNVSQRNSLYGCGIEDFYARISQYSNISTDLVLRSGKWPEKFILWINSKLFPV
jgi:hypothetical protein